MDSELPTLFGINGVLVGTPAPDPIFIDYKFANRDVYLIQAFYNWTSFSFFGWDLMHSYIGLGGGVAKVRAKYAWYSKAGQVADVLLDGETVPVSIQIYEPGYAFSSSDTKKTVPAVALSAGISYDLTRWVSIDAGMRYTYMHFQTNGDVKYRGLSTIEGLAGLRINFW